MAMAKTVKEVRNVNSPRTIRCIDRRQMNQTYQCANKSIRRDPTTESGFIPRTPPPSCETVQQYNNIATTFSAQQFVGSSKDLMPLMKHISFLPSFKHARLFPHGPSLLIVPRRHACMHVAATEPHPDRDSETCLVSRWKHEV